MQAYRPTYATQQLPAELWYAPSGVGLPYSLQQAQPILGQPSPYYQPFYLAEVSAARSVSFGIEPYGSPYNAFQQFTAAPSYVPGSVARPSLYPHYGQPFYPATVPVAGTAPLTMQLYGSPNYAPGLFYTLASVASTSPYPCYGQPLVLSMVPVADRASFTVQQHGSIYYAFRQLGAEESYTYACIASPSPYPYYRQPLDLSLVRVAGGTPFIMQPCGSPSYPYYGQMVHPNLVLAPPTVCYIPPLPFQPLGTALLGQFVHLSHPQPTVMSTVHQETSPAASARVAFGATRQDEPAVRKRRPRHEQMEAALSSPEQTERSDNCQKAESTALASASVSAAVAGPCLEACNTVDERPIGIYRKY